MNPIIGFQSILFSRLDSIINLKNSTLLQSLSLSSTLSSLPILRKVMKI
uniref:Uncharacterized protein n=1 Tax=Arundo donax TaxID=35708 RepID=A0A0A9SY16_ARUDO